MSGMALSTDLKEGNAEWTILYLICVLITSVTLDILIKFNFNVTMGKLLPFSVEKIDFHLHVYGCSADLLLPPSVV